MLEAARAGESVLLIAPTGGGKTLAGFLPSLVDLYEAPREGLHTLYVSPLKALATDIARNLMAPVTEMALPIRIETRTGDTPSNRRARQKLTPPHLLLTTPESLAVLIASPDAAGFFGGLSAIVMDEVHALAGTKRGDQLALCVVRLVELAPSVRRIGLSATVAHPEAIRAFTGASRIIAVEDGAPPNLSIMLPAGRLSWGGHMGLEAAPDVMARIRDAGMTIVFVNTRAQAELMFQALWRLNDPMLPSNDGKSRPRWRRDGCARSWRHRRWTLASIGAASIRSSRSARRRACLGCCNASAAPITAWTKPATRSWCRPTALKCWNARRRSRVSRRKNSTATRRGRADWMCWRNIYSASPARRRSIPMMFFGRCGARRPTRD
jgi:Lhr-like helicase